jgi:molybdopterin adenylyltransferase
MAACSKMLPGFGELMRSVSLQQVATAILSRQTAGIRGTTLIINLPGRPSSIRVCLDAIFPAIPYCLDLIGQPGMKTDPARCKAFRPSS